MELLWANWYVAAIVIAKLECHKDYDYLYQLINKEKITLIHFVPSMLDVFLNYLSTKEYSQCNLQIVFCSGEALKNNTCDTFYKLIPDISLYLYGPTEASIDVNYSLCEPDKKVTIGKPISNTKLYILDNYLLPTPIGAPGELYIGGAGLARGYLNLPQLTKEKFINNPFATLDDIAKGYTRLYKTGDICKW
ncbi:MAG: AMP-binding protein, partial [Francisella endosymbiont of Hyalomma asiaticum]